jgi:hypothetical protein
MYGMLALAKADMCDGAAAMVLMLENNGMLLLDP